MVRVRSSSTSGYAFTLCVCYCSFFSGPADPAPWSGDLKGSVSDNKPWIFPTCIVAQWVPSLWLSISIIILYILYMTSCITFIPNSHRSLMVGTRAPPEDRLTDGYKNGQGKKITVNVALRRRIRCIHFAVSNRHTVLWATLWSRQSRIHHGRANETTSLHGCQDLALQIRSAPPCVLHNL